MSIFIIAGSDTLGIFPILVLPSENFTVDIKPPIEIEKAPRNRGACHYCIKKTTGSAGGSKKL